MRRDLLMVVLSPMPTDFRVVVHHHVTVFPNSSSHENFVTEFLKHTYTSPVDIQALILEAFTLTQLTYEKPFSWTSFSYTITCRSTIEKRLIA